MIPNAVMSWSWLVLAVLPSLSYAAATDVTCSRNTDLLQYTSVECRINPPESGVCSVTIKPDGGALNECENPCRVWTGMRLEISCKESSQVLYRGDVTLGQQNVMLPFATTAEVEARYTCRDRGTGAVLATRWVTLDESVYVIPSQKPYDQVCIEDIVGEYDCNVAATAVAESPSANHSIGFNVLGERPIQLSVEAFWVDHFPVDLKLSYNSHASNTTIVHEVGFSIDDVYFIDDSDVKLYLAITANNSDWSSTMCISVTLFGDPNIFINESLPADVTVPEGDPAQFTCQVQTIIYPFMLYFHSTVAFLARSQDSDQFEQCLNCSFTASALLFCTTSVDRAACSELFFTNYSVGHPHLLMHHLAATWKEVNAKQNWSEVACAVAIDGTTQWFNSAKLTVTDRQLLEEQTAPRGNTLKSRDVALITVGSLAVVVFGGSIVGIIIIIYNLMKRKKSANTTRHWKLTPMDDTVDLVE